jgi:uncharacterized protein with HEPN domain
MEMNEKDTNILNHIIQHCENIFSAMNRFGDFSVLKIDIDYFNSVCMSLLQIGELSNHLSEEFKQNNADIPWRNIIGLRNVVVHGYGHLDINTVWATLQEDIPKLNNYCKGITETTNNKS